MTIERGREVGKKWRSGSLAEELEPFDRFKMTGTGWDRPSLHLEDVSAIPGVNVIPGVEQYQHRARVRASDRDLFAAVSPIPDGYEEYCTSLGLGSPDLVLASPTDSPMAVTKACLAGDALESLREWARTARSIYLHPYMSIAEVWELADVLAAEEGVEVQVVGPPPPTLWIANDKASLHRIISEVCGEEWLVETHASNDPKAIVTKLRGLAEKFDRVGLKRTRCASAMGNRVYKSADLLGLSDGDFTNLLERFAEETGWTEGEELLAVEWVDAVASPSTQVWIPALGSDPIVEGVYEQILEGDEQVFVGSRPSTLSDEVNGAIAESSRAISAAFQELGYSGRCSFDFIVAKGEPRAYFTECNGRWGGTSTPMHLADRLFTTRPHYVAQDWQHEALEGMTFQQLHDALEEHLWLPDRPDGRFVLYNVGPLANDGKFDVISIGDSPDEAWAGTQEVLPKLLLG